MECTIILNTKFVVEEQLSFGEEWFFRKLVEKMLDPLTPRTLHPADGKIYFILPTYDDLANEIGRKSGFKGNRVTASTFETEVPKLLYEKGLIYRRDRNLRAFAIDAELLSRIVDIQDSRYSQLYSDLQSKTVLNDPTIQEVHARELRAIIVNFTDLQKKREQYLEDHQPKEKKPTLLKPVDPDNILGGIKERKVETNETFTSISNYPVSDECIEHHGLSILHVAVERYHREKAVPMRGVDNEHGRRKLDNLVYYSDDFEGCRQYIEKGDCSENKLRFTEKIYNAILKDLQKKGFLFLLPVPSYLTDTEGYPVYEPLKYRDGEVVYPQKRAKETNSWIRFENWNEYLRDEKYQEWYNYVKGNDEHLFEDFFTGPIVMGARSDMIDFGSADNNKKISKKKYLKPKKVS